MGRTTVKIAMEGPGGVRYNMSIEGKVTRERLLQVYEMMNLMDIEEGPKEAELESVGSRIWHIVNKFYPSGRFTSSDILEKYEDEFHTPIKLSVISTYLSRFTDRGRVDRTKAGREWVYQAPKLIQQP